MFGNHFYHQRIRSAVAVFGSLFNNVNVLRKNSSGATISQVKVPLSYAPARDFISRIDAMNKAGEQGERKIAVKLPRMSFEIVAMNYDAQRQLPKVNNCVIPSATFGKSTQVFTPVPYNINFQLNIYSKGQDDALQIVEQILPYFTPSYTITMRPLEDFSGVKEDVPVILQGITFSDDFEAALESRRTVIYTLDFEMKVSMYKSINPAAPIITQYDIDNLQMNGDELYGIQDSAATASPLATSTLEDTPVTIENFQMVNVPLDTHGLSLGTNTPDNGTATVTYGKLVTSASGVIVATGEYKYTPDSNWNGVDTFDIDLLFGDSSSPMKLTKTVTVAVGAVQDVTATTLGPFAATAGTGLLIDVSTNDSFASPTYAIVSTPSKGTVIINSSTGVATYTGTVGQSGSDQFVYRVAPTGGISENVTVTLTVS